jgi:hypothetical protein
MSQDHATPETDADSAPAETADTTELTAQLEVLTEENRRLREEYARAQRTQYRRTALALAAVGTVAVLGGALFPDSRTVLFALGGTGVFAAVLTYYLTPEQFIAAEVGEGVYSALAETGSALIEELGLQDEEIYVPGPETADDPAVRLFVPQHTEFTLPDSEALDSMFVITDAESERGVAVHPTGGPLFREFERTLSGDLHDETDLLAEQLSDGLVEQFELVESATPEIEGSDERVSVGLSGSAYGSVDRFDHPVASFLGVGFAAGLDCPVTVETTTVDDDRADYLVTCSWAGMD